ncbi:putative zinc finger protein [Sodiomyces alkalinus F11]|uniref:Putative zinc finger protein n=1 Tax=Sodiomyces alkalinus (strain CBS 110278 / VKM F-3762 / F11) TaxID=1314773 RepID=A0A3N2PU26_SODAK|nr:putative zinc finger protein [Sodiomyces alkalinus F11]ROT38007.1 putative zinc finger protein [Sodiomyces alkalinus F11]
MGYYECDTCTRRFRTSGACDQHMRDTNHFNQDDEYPYECRFNNANNLRMHLNSRVHKGTQMDCPFCDRSFVTATGLAHHLESGGCRKAPFLSRDRVYEIVRRQDPHGAISKNLLDWHGSSEYEATSASWNGDFYECVLCHREFNSLHGLNMHLKSPVHQQSLYHCPNRGCRSDFKSLAGLINHLESESCGYKRFATVQKHMGGMLSRDRMLTY